MHHCRMRCISSVFRSFRHKRIDRANPALFNVAKKFRFMFESHEYAAKTCMQSLSQVSDSAESCVLCPHLMSDGSFSQVTSRLHL